MPKVVDQFLGRLRGKIGDVIFKITHGISYAGRAPLPRPASTDPKSVATRKKFGIANKLAHAVNAITFLKYFWKLAPITGSASFQTTTNKIMKRNYSHVLEDGLTDSVALVPDVGFTFSTTSITLANDEIVVVGAPVGYTDLIDTQVEKTFRLAMVLFLKTPASEEFPQYYFIHAATDDVTLNLINPITFTIPLTTMESKYYDGYTVRKAYFSLVTLTEDGVPVHYSDTVVSA